MSSSKEENSWESHYQTKNTKWDRGGSSFNLTRWLENGDLTPCRIMVPGCGNGHEVITLAEQGFDVVCIDIAPTAIANLRRALDKRGLTAELIENDFFSLNFSSQPFDAIYEQTCLCALQPSQWEAFEKWLRQSLKTGGKLHTNFMQTGQEGGPPFHCEMEEMHTLFANDKWLWEKADSAKKMQALTEKMEIPCILRKI